jgi:hypothetical protein
MKQTKHFYRTSVFQFLLLLFSICFANAQVNISPTTFTFGEVTNWKNPEALFFVTNTGNKPLVFLPQFPKEDLLVELPTEPILPGESEIIKVHYYTSLPGSFEKKFEVYVNVSDKPITLTVKGDIMSFNADALVTCPGFAPKTFGQTQSFNQTIHVVDKQNQFPLKDVTVRILGNNSEYIGATDMKGDLNQKIMLGLHDILLSKVGYMPELRIFYLNKNTGTIVVEMKRDTSYRLIDAGIKFKVDTLEFERPSEDTVATETITALIPTESPDLLPVDKYNANNIVFLIDASTSMKYANKLPLLKTSMKELFTVLREIDRVSLITYSSTASIVASGISGNKKDVLGHKIDSIVPFSWTNGVKGIETAYALADKNYAMAGNNQIILATDGLFNSPSFDEDALMNLVKQQAKYGIKLSVIGFGDDEKAHKLMKKLASYGNGNFILIKSNTDSGTVLIEEIKTNSQKKE